MPSEELVARREAAKQKRETERPKAEKTAHICRRTQLEAHALSWESDLPVALCILVDEYAGVRHGELWIDGLGEETFALKVCSHSNTCGVVESLAVFLSEPHTDIREYIVADTGVRLREYSPTLSQLFEGREPGCVISVHRKYRKWACHWPVSNNFG